MKRVLLDENLDWRLKSSFDTSVDVSTVRDKGWDGLENGELLQVAESEFDVLVTLDRNLQYQQHIAELDLAIILISCRTSRRSDIEPVMPAVNRAVQESRPGTVTTVAA